MRRRGQPRAGQWAFWLHRLSGLGLVVYLYLHLALLGWLRAGPAGWDAFVALARSPAFLLLDAILLAGLAVHALNGVRLTALGLGWGLAHWRALAWAMLGLSALVTAVGAIILWVR